MHLKNTIHRIVAGLCSLIALALLGVALSAFVVAGPSVRSTVAGAPADQVVAADPTGPDRATAIDLCHRQMLLKLRSPSEATFPGWSAADVTMGEIAVLVRDYVDAPNAFGTPVRTHFLCEIHVDPGTTMHRIVDFQLLD